MTETHTLANTGGEPLNDLILTLRSQPVLVDADLAALYGVTTKALNQAVQRNIERFPKDFKFQLNQEEKDELVTNCDRFKRLKHSSTLPQAFTEQGVFFDGQIFDAYRFVSDLLRQASHSVVLIDNYVDDRVLDQLNKRNAGTTATILCKKISRSLQNDLDRHNAQYPPIRVIEFSLSHDRFLILDESQVYHLGASLKDLGNKWFAFSRLDASALKVMDRIKDLLE